MSSATELFNCVLEQDIVGVRRELNDSNPQVDQGGARRLFWCYETPLEVAVTMDSDEIVELLINAGANVNVRNGNVGWTPLHRTAYRGKCDIMRMLIRRGANKEARDIHGETPLFKAWGEGVELLLEEDSNVDAVNHGGLTPLMHAVRHGEVETVKMLLAHHAAVDAKDNHGLTPLMHLTGNWGSSQCQPICLVIANILLEHGADVFAEALDGKTALTFAVRESYHDLEKFLRLEMDRQKYTAFAMASNDRLGKGSQAAQIDEEMRRMIWNTIKHMHLVGP